MSIRSAFLAFLALAAIAPCSAAEVSMLTTGAFKPVALGMIPAFEKQTGHKVVLANDTAGGVARRIADGEAFDLVVLTPSGLRDLAAKGKVVPTSIVDLVRVGIGVGIRTGDTVPDISSVDAFRKMLIDAPSVAYIDPASGGSSGIYLAGLFQRLGIADTIAPKAVLVRGGLVAERLVDGKATVGMQQISEILAVKGATLVGPLPAEVQNYTIYSGAIGTAARAPDAANQLLSLFQGEQAKAEFKSHGMEAAKP